MANGLRYQAHLALGIILIDPSPPGWADVAVDPTGLDVNFYRSPFYGLQLNCVRNVVLTGSEAGESDLQVLPIFRPRESWHQTD